ncbi:MAG: AMP-binding protein, partial [Acidobacteriota bacterium]|nr:AMP-binding protein [Acidobacteriota bacterium]
MAELHDIGRVAVDASSAAPGTVWATFQGTVRKHGDRPALREKRDGDWRTVTWMEYYEEVRRAARGLIRLGVDPGRGVAIMGYNRPRWFVADLAAIAAGAVPTGIYNTCTSEQCRYVAHHCEAAVIVLEDDSHLDRFDPVELPHLRAIVLMHGEPDPRAVRNTPVYSWGRFLESGQAVAEEALDSRIVAQRPDDLCTLIYTSGTTGEPKGVMLSHRNIDWVGEQLLELYSFGPTDNLLSYLPLSHIAEQVISLHAPLKAGACTWFAESMEELGNNLREVRPDIFLGVPRVWEKIQAKMAAAGAASAPLRRKLVAWARRRGLRGARDPRWAKGTQHALAERLVFSRVRERLGLDRARVCATSAAPISLDTLEFFASLGIPLLEIYGMSECTGPATISLPDRYRIGKAGFEIPGAELAIAEDGEILIRGPHVFLGYYKNERATRETVDAEGWIHSGD